MKKSIILKYVAIGVLFGLCFPIGAIVFELFLNQKPFSITNLLWIHNNNKLLYMIDTAPLFLGIFSLFGGISKAKTEQINLDLQNAIKDRASKEKMSMILNETEKIVKELLTISKILSKSAAKSKNNMMSTFEISEKIISDIQNNIEKINQLFKLIKEIDITTKSINQNIDNTYETIENMKSNMKETVDSVCVLNDLTIQIKDNIYFNNGEINDFLDKVKIINDLLEEINGIGRQIGMLALNSAIEASRLGVAGKGFEVIASEISKLASKTNETSKMIENLALDMEERGKTIKNVLDKQRDMIKEIMDTVTNIDNYMKHNFFLTEDVYSKMNNIMQLTDEQNKKQNVASREINILEQNNNYMIENVKNINYLINKEMPLVDDLEKTSKEIEKKSISLKEVVQYE